MQIMWNRREVLGSAAGALFGGILVQPRWAAAGAASKPTRFPLGIQSYSLRGYEVDDALKHAHALGIKTLELFSKHLPLAASDEQIAELRRKVSGLGMTLLSHGVDSFTKDDAANRRIFEMARKAGIRNITCDPTEDSFDSLDKLVAEFKIRVAIHNHGPGARYDKLSDVLNAIKGRHELIGACADLGHYIRAAEDPVRVIHLLRGRLYGVHLKDFRDRDKRTRGVLLGAGHLDVEGVLRALAEVNFPQDACLAIEYEEKPADPIDDIRQCVAITTAAAEKAAQ